MTRLSGAIVGTIAFVCLSAALFAQEPPAAPAPLVRDIRLTGVHELAADAVTEAARVAVGQPLPVPPDRVDDLGARIVRHYRDEGYTFAEVKSAFDVAAGVLSFDVDEGVIGAVEFTGVDDRLRHRFEDEFALRAGDVFNRRRARQALDVLLRPTRGAIQPGRIFERNAVFTDSRELPGNERRNTFDLVTRNGQRVLLVGLREPAGRFKLVPDLGDREDWFTSVDGFVPSFGFGAAVFDHDNFNHAYVAGHMSLKTASGHAGYALGFERPFLLSRKLYVGAELHDLTASDDQWQVSSLEASLAAIGPRRSFRDYYRRRGVQIGAAYRPHPQVELLAAWRGERHEALGVESDFSFWNGDEPFRPNTAVQTGRLNAVIVGASVDGAGFASESLDAGYRRHQLDSLFGERLDAPRTRNDPTPIWRIDWTSEISPSDAFGSDFDFNRHIVSARYRTPLSPHQDFGVRAIGGWSGGTLPPQRLFSIGGIGSVHGYDFKESTGTSLALLNLEYALGWRAGLQLLGFYDAGRTAADPGWLRGLGWGIGLGDFRIDFGYRQDAVPSSLHVVLRFGRTF
jgi:hypothetical protein